MERREYVMKEEEGETRRRGRMCKVEGDQRKEGTKDRKGKTTEKRDKIKSH